MPVNLYLLIAPVRHVCSSSMSMFDLCFCALIKAVLFVVKVMLTPEPITGFEVVRNALATL